MNLGIADRRAAVAAASQGLGFAAAQALANEGVRVAICGRDRVRIEKAARRIGSSAVPLVCDISTADGGAQFIRLAEDAIGEIDIVVTNAGGPIKGGFTQTPVDEYAGALELGLMSVIGMCKAAVPAMQNRGWGRVVAITSVTARQPMDDLILSNTARAGVTGFLKTLAREVAGDGVTVNGIQPGPHKTARMSQLGVDFEPSSLGIRTGTLGDPMDFGALVAMVCSVQAKFLIGAQIPLDGGSFTGLQ